MKRDFCMALVAFSIAALGTAHADPIEGARSTAEILESSTADDWRVIPDDELLVIDLERGRVSVALSTSLAQAHVANIKELASAGFFDGLSFYRVIEGFVAQGGDVLETRENPATNKTMAAQFDEPLVDDLKVWVQPDRDGYAPQVGWLDSLPVGLDAADKKIWHLHCTGAFAMARDTERDTASTEFYITLQPQRYLDRNLTVLGRVVDGMEHLQALRRVDPPQSEEDDMGEAIVSMRLASDLAEENRPRFEILDSNSPVFAEFSAARRNRPEDFFYHRPDYLDACALPVPVREHAIALAMGEEETTDE